MQKGYNRTGNLFSEETNKHLLLNRLIGNKVEDNVKLNPVKIAAFSKERNEFFSNIKKEYDEISKMNIEEQKTLNNEIYNNDYLYNQTEALNTNEEIEDTLGLLGGLEPEAQKKCLF